MKLRLLGCSVFGELSSRDVGGPQKLPWLIDMHSEPGLQDTNFTFSLHFLRTRLDNSCSIYELLISRTPLRIAMNLRNP